MDIGVDIGSIGSSTRDQLRFPVYAPPFVKTRERTREGGGFRKIEGKEEAIIRGTPGRRVRAADAQSAASRPDTMGRLRMRDENNGGRL